VWDYSLANIEQLRQLGIHHVAHVPVGYVPEMTCISPAVERDIDVLFYGSLNERRQLILEALEEKGVTVKVLFEVYGAERDAYIARSKIVLNLHFYEAKVFEIVRISYLLSNRVFVISERGCCPEEEAYFAEGLVFADYDHLVKTCIDYLQQPEQRDFIAQKGFELMQACRESDYLAQGIEAIERIQPAHNPGGIFIKDFYRKHLAKSAFYQGEYEQAVTLYEETLTVDPEDVESYWALGLVWHCLGDVLAAEMVWSIPLNSEDMDQLQNLLNFLHREREFLAQNPQVVLEPVRHKILTEIEAILEELNP
jgi:tetratricopeptide (TPR) repeat protein